jgi:polyhydroxybutyrate depolymerase
MRSYRTKRVLQHASGIDAWLNRLKMLRRHGFSLDECSVFSQVRDLCAVSQPRAKPTTFTVVSIRLRVAIAIAAVAIVAVASACRSSDAARSATVTSTTTPTPACTTARLAPRTNALHHFVFQGNDRTYLLALPPTYDGHRAFPTVFSLAGFGSTVQAHELNTSMARTGAGRGFIVVTPAALGNPAQWNIFSAKGQADDYAFLHALVADLEQRLCIDRSRVFAAGYSNGSAFAGFLVCLQLNVFAAVAMVEATTPAGCPDGVAPSVIAIAGTADPAVLFNGGTGLSHTPIPAAPRTIAAYAEHYHCDATPVRDLAAPGVHRTRYRHCSGGSEVILDAVTGGTHDYPGGLVAAHDRSDSPAGRSFPATFQILDFFAHHHASWTL